MSGVQKWNGTALTLNANPPSVRKIATAKSGLVSRPGSFRYELIPLNSVDPVSPYTNDIPYNMIAVDSTPMMKYLMAASFEFSSCLRQPARMNVGIVIVSRATKIEIRSRAEAITTRPSTDVSSRK